MHSTKRLWRSPLDTKRAYRLRCFIFQFLEDHLAWFRGGSRLLPVKGEFPSFLFAPFDIGRTLRGEMLADKGGPWIIFLLPCNVRARASVKDFHLMEAE
jgi:hypothetical protein